MPGSHRWDKTALLQGGRLRTTIHHARRGLPFLGQFMDKFHEDEQSVIKAVDVFPDYVAFVTARTEDVQALTAARSVDCEAVFIRQFRPEALHRRWPERCRAGRRGFGMSLGRRRRVLTPPVDILAAALQYLRIPGNAWEGFWRRMFLDRVKGHGAVTTRVVPCNTVVAEYLGELIPEALAQEREDEYHGAGAIPTMFKFPGALAFDGYRDHLGQPLDPEDNPCVNPGAVVNHSKASLNCKAVQQEVEGRLRLFIITTKTVPAGAELLYDYGDNRRDVDDWLHH